MRARSLARRWALTPPFHPYPFTGGMFSVPLSADHSAPPLTATLPCGARTFLFPASGKRSPGSLRQIEFYHLARADLACFDRSVAICFTSPVKTATTTVMLVRHARPIPPGVLSVNDDDRPLTPEGFEAARSLADAYAEMRIDAIYSSPYRRARQTIEPLASRLGIAIEIVQDLRERYLTTPGVPDHVWMPHLRRSWQDLDYAPPGGETGRVAQRRILEVLSCIRARHPSGTVVAGSHGNLIALALNAIDSALGMDFWQVMPMPAVYRVRACPEGWSILSGPNVGSGRQREVSLSALRRRDR